MPKRGVSGRKSRCWQGRGAPPGDPRGELASGLLLLGALALLLRPHGTAPSGPSLIWGHVALDSEPPAPILHL